MNHEVFIAIWPKGHDPMAFAIRTLTRGYGSHAAFVRGNGKIAENFYPHVRERDWQTGERNKVEVYRIKAITAAECATLEKWISKQLKRPPKYSILDLLRYAINLPPKRGSECFCSQWVLRGLRECLPENKQPLARLEYQDFASPRDMRLSPLLIECK